MKKDEEIPALLCQRCILDLNRAIVIKDSFLKSNEHFCSLYGEDRVNEKAEDDFHDEIPMDVSELDALRMTFIKEEPLDFDGYKLETDDGRDSRDFKCVRCSYETKSEIEFFRHLNSSHLDAKLKGTIIDPQQNSSKSHSKQRGTARNFTKVDDDLRFDNIGHLIQVIEKRRRCQGILCQSVVSTECCKCDIGLCTKCFMDFHTKSSSE